MENKIEISENEVSKRIYSLREHPVMLDSDLAEIYEVEVRILKRAVRANIERFPTDFMFELTREEFENFGNSLRARTDLRSNFWILRTDARFQPYMPFAFTESGIAMLSGVLHSQKAIQVNIEIMRAFVQLRKQPKAQH
ncbi:MAG: ORF6N domain-containing protein, partial [Myxococcaceae bacterium]